MSGPVTVKLTRDAPAGTLDTRICTGAVDGSGGTAAAHVSPARMVTAGEAPAAETRAGDCVALGAPVDAVPRTSEGTASFARFKTTGRRIRFVIVKTVASTSGVDTHDGGTFTF